MSSKSTHFDFHVLDATVTTSSELAITHDLGRKPADGFVVASAGNSTIFRGSTAWTDTTIYLQATGSDTAIRLVIF